MLLHKWFPDLFISGRKRGRAEADGREREGRPKLTIVSTAKVFLPQRAERREARAQPPPLPQFKPVPTPRKPTSAFDAAQETAPAPVVTPHSHFATPISSSSRRPPHSASIPAVAASTHGQALAITRGIFSPESTGSARPKSKRAQLETAAAQRAQPEAAAAQRTPPFSTPLRQPSRDQVSRALLSQDFLRRRALEEEERVQVVLAQTQSEAPLERAREAEELKEQKEVKEVEPEEADEADDVIEIMDTDEEEQPAVDEVGPSEDEEEHQRPQLLRQEDVDVWGEDALEEFAEEEVELLESAWCAADYKEVMAECAGDSVSRRSCCTLMPGCWVNDEVINFYLRFLLAKNRARPTGPGTSCPRCAIFTSYFYSQLSDNGRGYRYANVHRFTRKAKLDISKVDRLLVPINEGQSHWTLAVVNFKRKCFQYYDSMGGTCQQAYEDIVRYVDEEYRDKHAKGCDISGWPVHWLQDIPMQANSVDCGVFMMLFAARVSEGKAVNCFSQDDIPYWRRRIALDILTWGGAESFNWEDDNDSWEEDVEEDEEGEHQDDEGSDQDDDEEVEEEVSVADSEEQGDSGQDDNEVEDEVPVANLEEEGEGGGREGMYIDFLNKGEDMAEVSDHEFFVS
ncbi:unnamed protein product [Chrysoparadoxa australica]